MKLCHRKLSEACLASCATELCGSRERLKVTLNQKCGARTLTSYQTRDVLLLLADKMKKGSRDVTGPSIGEHAVNPGENMETKIAIDRAIESWQGRYLWVKVVCAVLAVMMPWCLEKSEAQTIRVDVTPSHVVNVFSPPYAFGIHSGSCAE